MSIGWDYVELWTVDIMEVDSDNSVNESSCDEENTEIETVKVSSSLKQKKDRGNILSFFPGSPTKNIPRPVSVENSHAHPISRC